MCEDSTCPHAAIRVMKISGATCGSLGWGRNHQLLTLTLIKSMCFFPSSGSLCLLCSMNNNNHNFSVWTGQQPQQQTATLECPIPAELCQRRRGNRWTQSDGGKTQHVWNTCNVVGDYFSLSVWTRQNLLLKGENERKWCDSELQRSCCRNRRTVLYFSQPKKKWEKNWALIWNKCWG